MNRPRIALIVDHPQRDLAGLVLTAVELCQRGAICYLVPMNLKDSEIWSLAPDFVLLNYLRRGNERLAMQMLGAGIQFGLLDTEGGAWADCDSYTELLWPDGALLKKASCLCMWGPTLAEYIVTQGLVLTDQVRVTGCPRFDFYAPRWRAMYQETNSTEAHRAAQRILVNTNFTLVNSRFKSVEKNIAIHQDVLGLPEAKVRSMVEAEEQGIRAMTNLIRNLAHDYPQVKVIIRPHPFEKSEFYQTQLNGAKNIEINNTGSVQSQIFRASVVIQRSCTTGIEASLASVPTLSPHWVSTQMLVPAAEMVSLPCHSYPELRLHLESILNAQYVPPVEIQRAIDTVVRDWFYKADGLAYQRVSETLLACLNGQRGVDERLCSRYLYGLNGSQPGDIGHLSNRLRYALKFPPDWSFRQMRVPPSNWVKSDKYFDAVKVDELTQAILNIRRSQGDKARSVIVTQARGYGNYSHKHNYSGHSVMLLCEL